MGDRRTGPKCQVQQDLEQPQVFLGRSVRAPCHLGELPDIATFGKAIETMSLTSLYHQTVAARSRAVTDFHCKLANKAHHESYRLFTRNADKWSMRRMACASRRPTRENLFSLDDHGYDSNSAVRKGSPHGWRDSLMFAGLTSHWLASKSSVRSYLRSQNFSALYQSLGWSNRTQPRFQALA
jgi:hypothetical protein